LEIATIGPFLKYFDNIRERTMRVAHSFPRTKLIGPTGPENLPSAISCATSP